MIDHQFHFGLNFALQNCFTQGLVNVLFFRLKRFRRNKTFYHFASDQNLLTKPSYMIYDISKTLICQPFQNIHSSKPRQKICLPPQSNTESTSLVVMVRMEK